VRHKLVQDIVSAYKVYGGSITCKKDGASWAGERRQRGRGSAPRASSGGATAHDPGRLQAAHATSRTFESGRWTQPLEGRAGSAGLSGVGSRRSSVRVHPCARGLLRRQSGPPDDRRDKAVRRTRHPKPPTNEGSRRRSWWSPVYLPDTRALPADIAEFEAFIQEVERLRQALADGVEDSAEALVELAKGGASDGSAATLEYLLTADADSYELVRDQAAGALRTLFRGRITADSIESAEAVSARRRSLAGTPESAASSRDGRPATSGRTRWSTRTDPRRGRGHGAGGSVTVTIAEGETVLRRERYGDRPKHMLVLEALGLTGHSLRMEVWVGIF